jgi:expansin (peptidoglycan-binding protein)
MFNPIMVTFATMAALVGTTTAAPTASPLAAAVTPNAAHEARAALAGGRFTYYTPGLGACGYANSEAEYVVALNHVDFDPYTPNGNPNNNPLCGRMIRASYNGKSVDVKLVDRCPGCNSGDLDLSPAAFSEAFSFVLSSCPGFCLLFWTGLTSGFLQRSLPI